MKSFSVANKQRHRITSFTTIVPVSSFSKAYNVLHCVAWTELTTKYRKYLSYQKLARPRVGSILRHLLLIPAIHTHFRMRPVSFRPYLPTKRLITALLKSNRTLSLSITPSSISIPRFFSPEDWLHHRAWRESNVHNCSILLENMLQAEERPRATQCTVKRSVTSEDAHKTPYGAPWWGRHRASAQHVPGMFSEHPPKQDPARITCKPSRLAPSLQLPLVLLPKECCRDL